ncbi:MAG: hypothetical protein CSB47_08710 [Proteobacteria bacterium]|nr:MAG: hypothetical protein CSB47_08710 [Pseudomonadota bacterium]
MSRRESVPSLAEKVVFFLSALLLLLVPLHVLVLSPPQVMLILECIAVLLLLIIFWSGLYQGKTHTVLLWFVFLSLLLAVAYVVPLTFLPTFDMPGRDLYRAVGQWLGSQGVEVSYSQLSLIPYVSVVALLALLPPLAMFFAGFSLPESQIRTLIYLLLVIAGLQAALGLVQYASGNPDFYFGVTPNGRSAQGTYINRDHFAALLEMTLPIAIGMMLYSVGRSQLDRNYDDKGWVVNQTLLFAFLAIFIFLAAVFTRSRMGVFLIMLAVLFSSFVFARHVGGRQSTGLTVIFSTVAIGLATSIGLIPVLNRFVAANPIEDERFRIFQHAFEGIRAFFPFGSGPGTFPDVYRAFQPIEQLRFINNAHSDYVELLFEMGLAGAFIIVGFMLLYVFGWFKLNNKSWGRMRFLQVGAGLGILMLLLHCSMDFILHEPMNSMVFALLVGVFFRKSVR